MRSTAPGPGPGGGATSIAYGENNNGVFLGLILAGTGFLLPYNCFILSVDFFQHRYPNSTIMFDMSMVYIVTAFFAVLLNNILMGVISLHSRITFGYVVAWITLVFVAIIEIDTKAFSTSSSYHVNLIAIGAVALGCTIQQSSFYGFASMLPPKYTQALMAGESAAGVWVSGNRILTKFILRNEERNTKMFFTLIALALTVCWLSYHFMRKSPFVEYYVALCQETRKKIVLEPSEDAGLMELENNDTPKGQYGVLKLQMSPPPDTNGSMNSEDSFAQNQSETGQFTAFSFANPVYEPGGNGLTSLNQVTLPLSGPSYKVEDIIIKPETTGSPRWKTWAGIKGGVRARWHVAQQIYPYMVFIALAYFVTMCLYPGILSEIVSCRFGSWMPVILMTAFNIGDLLGKKLAPNVSEWARSKLAACCSLRLLFLPLVLLCCVPRGSPHVAAAGDGGPIVLSLLLGISGGALGAAPMIAAAQRVRNDAKEMVGNIMTLSYNIGLTIGSLAAYLLDGMLGPQVPTNCNFFYPTIGPISKIITTTTTAILPNLTTLSGVTMLAASTMLVPSTVITEDLSYSSTQSSIWVNDSLIVQKNISLLNTTL